MNILRIFSNFVKIAEIFEFFNKLIISCMVYVSSCFGSGFGQLSGLAGEKFSTVFCNFGKSVCDHLTLDFLVFSSDSAILLDERDFATLSSLLIFLLLFDQQGTPGS